MGVGILFLNLVNIIRFVLLFVHIQKYGGYELTIDLHDLYNYVTYTLVFLMWVFWFERFSDIKKKKPAGLKGIPSAVSILQE